MMTKMETFKICPRCTDIHSDKCTLSRVDNSTHICSKCGIEEAMLEFTFYVQRTNLTKHDLIADIQHKVKILVGYKLNILKKSLQYKHYNNIINKLTLRIEQIENSD